MLQPEWTDCNGISYDVQFEKIYKHRLKSWKAEIIYSGNDEIFNWLEVYKI
jgi:hypothetical protein